MTRAGRRGREGGFALLIVLWSLVLITLLVTQVTASGRSELQLAANLRSAATLQAQADGAVHAAIFRLLGASPAWAADGALHTERAGDVAVAVRVTDEAGKLNPNIATEAVLAGLLRATGQGADTAERLAAAIVQWRSPSATPPGQGEKAQLYRAAGRDYAPPNAAFQTVDELSRVLGMTPAIVAALAPHLTLFTDTDPDARVASPAVATALALAGVPTPAGPLPPPRIVAVVAAAEGPGGARFTRRAIVSLGLDRAGRLFRIVAWDSPHA